VAVAGAAISDAGTAAVNWLAVFQVVASAVPFHCATDPATKFAPEMVRLNEGPPAAAASGFTAPMVGPAIVKGNGLVPVPAAELLAIETEAFAALTRAAAGTKAVKIVGLTYVVAMEAGEVPVNKR